MANLEFLLRCCGICLLLVSTATTAATAPADNTHHYQLANGLELLVREDKRAPVVVFQIWYKVGSRDEGRGHTGISHFLEHLMFKGTKLNPADAFAVRIAANGGDQNAATSHDYTYYYQEMEASRLPLSFELEADRMEHLTLSNEDIATEREVVKEERRLRTEDNPNAMLYERFYANSYLSSGYHHPIIGWMEDINQITLAELKQWYRRWYAPNNTVIVIAGDVVADEVYALAKSTFGKLKARELPIRKPRSEQPVLGQKHVVVNLPAKLPQLLLGFLTPTLATPSEAKWEPYALYLLSGALGYGDVSRLEREVVNKSRQAVFASSYYDVVGVDESLFTVSAIPREQVALPKLQQAVVEQIKRLQQELLTSAELARVKESVIADEIYSKDSLVDQASQLGHLTVVGLPWQLDSQFVANIKAVTVKQVQQVARKYLDLKKMSTAYLQPTALKDNHES